LYEIGFYWVKLKPTESSPMPDWQPAKFLGYMEYGDKEQMWVLCGSEPFYEDLDFSAIIPLYPPQ
jgi:hypothetical protein